VGIEVGVVGRGSNLNIEVSKVKEVLDPLAVTTNVLAIVQFIKFG
jgi:hypothetical protein